MDDPREFLRFDALRRTVSIGDREVRLTRLEFSIARYLVERAGEAVSARDLLRSVWGYDDDRTGTVAVHMHQLRRKLETDPSSPRLFTTVRGSGYRFRG